MDRVHGVLGLVKTKATTSDPVCGCVSLQKATLAVAIFNIVFAGISLIFAIVVAIFLTSVGVAVGTEVAKETDEDGKPDPDREATGASIAVFATIVGIVLIVVYAAILGLAVLLYVGAKKRDYSKCKLWFIISIICAVIVILDAFGGLVSFAGFIRLLVTLLIAGYQLWIVYAFMHEIDPDNLAARLEGGGAGDFQGIGVTSNPNEVQFSKNPYETQQQQPSGFSQPDPYGWDN